MYLCTIYIGFGNTNDDDRQPSTATHNNIEDHYEIGNERTENVHQFRTVRHTTDIRFKNLKNASNPAETASQIFNRLINQVTKNLGSNCRVGLGLSHPDLESDIYIPFRQKTRISGEDIIAQFEKVQQSNRTVQLDDSNMHVTITTRVGSKTFLIKKTFFFKKKCFSKKKCFF